MSKVESPLYVYYNLKLYIKFIQIFLYFKLYMRYECVDILKGVAVVIFHDNISYFLFP